MLLEFIKNESSTLTVKELCAATGVKNDSTYRGWINTKPELLRAVIHGVETLKQKGSIMRTQENTELLNKNVYVLPDNINLSDTDLFKNKEVEIKRLPAEEIEKIIANLKN